MIHYDPVATDDPELEMLKEQVAQVLTGIDPKMSFHDLRMVKGVGHSNLIFDVALPRALAGKESAIRKEIERALMAKNQSTYHAVITFDAEDFN